DEAETPRKNEYASRQHAVHTAAARHQAGDRFSRFLVQPAAWIAAAPSLGKGDPPAQRGADPEVEYPHRGPALPDQQPEPELLLGQAPEENRHEDETQNDRQAAVQPDRGSADCDSSRNGRAHPAVVCLSQSAGQSVRIGTLAGGAPPRIQS